MLYLVVGLIFAFTALVVWVALTSVFSDERAVSKRLGSLTAYETGQAAAAHPTLKPFNERVVAPAARMVTGAAVSLAPAGYRERVGHRIVLAGSPRAMSVGRFFSIKVLSGLGVLSLFVAVAAITGLAAWAWIVAIALVVLAFYAPDLWLSGAVEERQSKIRRELPDFLDMLTISVEAGLGFDAAIAKLVRTTRGPLAQEFARMLQQVQAGVDRASALRGMSDRTGVAELDSFIGAIIQAETFGISIASVLRVQAKEMRLKRRQYAEERAQKVPVKIVFPIILCILPATMIIVIGPAVISIGTAFGMF